MKFLYTLTLALIVFMIYLIGWNTGWEVGGQYGYDKAVISGILKVKVECK